jgi:hypothetical protein
VYPEKLDGLWQKSQRARAWDLQVRDAASSRNPHAPFGCGGVGPSRCSMLAIKQQPCVASPLIWGPTALVTRLLRLLPRAANSFEWRLSK